MKPMPSDQISVALKKLEVRYRERAHEENKVASAAICMNAVFTAASSGAIADTLTDVADDLAVLLKGEQ